jgi:Tfp pilus assembly protein PilX
MKHPQHHNQEGFSLFLVAILLVVAAITATTALHQSTRDNFWNPRVETQQKLTQIANAIALYQRLESRLPCPASLSLAQSNANHGVENAAACTAPGTVVYGAVPYKALQIPEETSVDAWGNKIRLSVTKSLTTTVGFGTTGAAGTITVNAPTGNQSTEAAFVLVSHGPDNKGAHRNFSGTGPTACTAGTGLDVENCDNDTTFYVAPIIDEAGASHFDDHVEWNTIDYTAASS